MLKIGIIGYGYWGPNLLRNLFATPNCGVESVADFRQERLNGIHKNYPSIKTTTDPNDILLSSKIDAVVIATPVHTHYELGKKALENGKHVLLEKPVTSSSAQAAELINIAGKKGLLIMVDHTFLYTGAVQKMKNLVQNGEIGKLQYLDSTRINLGLFQPDINVLWDLAPHDISVLTFLNNEIPVSVNARGISHTNNNVENIAYMTLNYQSGFIAHFHCSWSSPVKIRMMLMGGDKKMVVYNDMEPTEKIKVYETGYHVRNDEEKRSILVDYRVGDIFVPKLSTKEALTVMSEDFVNSILNKSQPIANVGIALNVVKILEAAEHSIKNNGKEVKL
jgi:predicted dehydrogenase